MSTPQTITSSSGTYGRETSNTVGYPLDHIYSGAVYAFHGTGGYSTSQGFQNIALLSKSPVSVFDTTGAVEVLFDVKTFNNHLGITKDNNYIVTSTAYYDSSNEMFLQDSLTIPASEFITGLNNNASNVVSVGKYSSLYTDFTQYMTSYFGLPTRTTATGFRTLFLNEQNFNPNGGVFDSAAFIKMVTASAPTSAGGYVNALSGQITLSNITQLLRTAVTSNPFGNRDPSNGMTAGDINHRNNYGVSDGFYADDIIFIPTGGIQITLKLVVDTEAFPSPLNNMGPTFAQNTGTAQDSSFNSNTNSTSIFTEISTPTTTLITRTLSAPLLIRLANLS